MKLSQLLEGVGVLDRISFRDVEVSGLSADSRSIRPGEVFVAVRGHVADGQAFVEDAIAKGAAAVVAEKPCSGGVPAIVVGDASAAAAAMARSFYGDPAARLVLVGVTGTNGKTSTTFLLRAILERALGPTGLIGTVGSGAGAALEATANTTPGPIDLQRLLASFASEGCAAAVMEVSSHSIVQGRIAGLEFDAGVYTNITRDHLDYHGTFENYISAKKRFADTLIERGRRKRPGTLVANVDDERVAALGERFPGPLVSYGLAPAADVHAERLEADLDGTRFDLVIGRERARLSLRLLGTFSAYNALAAAAAAHALGAPLADITAGLEGVAAVPGRFQVMRSRRGPTAVIDYAHTPDALEKLLGFCRELHPKRIITVFGCGGDRDRGKRPLMARIAERLSDLVIVTDDNPRTEDPERIVAEILAGFEGSPESRRLQRDRAAAIREAIGEARRGDLVVIAGKGHETYQIVGAGRVPFSDTEETARALQAWEDRHQG